MLNDDDDGDMAGEDGLPDSEALGRICKSLPALRHLTITRHLNAGPLLPPQIGDLTNLESLEVSLCCLTSLPEELGELSRLTKLDLARNLFDWEPPREEGEAGADGGGADDVHRFTEDDVFPPALGTGLRSLRELDLSFCDLRAVPAFLGGLYSLEVLSLNQNKIRVDAQPDFLLDGCPRLREVKVRGAFGNLTSRAYFRDFAAKLRAKNPEAKVVFDH